MMYFWMLFFLLYSFSLSTDLCLLRFSQAFEQAGIEAGPVFTKGGDINIEKIEQSKYFRALRLQSKGTALNGLVKRME